MAATNIGTKQDIYDIKIMLFGNSILKHGPNSGIGWKPDWGMSASMEERDYVHRLMDYYVKNKYGSISYALNQFAGFERAVVAVDDYNYTELLLPIKESVSAYRPDIVNLQMGENVAVSGLTPAQYAHAVTSLVHAIEEGSPGVRVMLCTPFWGGEAKVKGIYLAAEQLGLPVSDLSSLNVDENKALGLFAHGGVASHPGDYGMDNIAKLIWRNLDRVIAEQFTPRSITLPEEIVLSVGNGRIETDGGTLKISAKVLPEGAVGEVHFSVEPSDFAEISADGVLTAKNDGVVSVKASSQYQSAEGVIEIVITGQSKPHTVSYLSGTTDAVTGLPEPNRFAKGLFILSTQKPFRETYQFAGWVTEQGGEVVQTISVSEDTAVKAVWRKAACWDFADGKNGLRVYNGFNINLIGGKLMAIATGTNAACGAVLCFESPKLALPAKEYKAVKITMQNTVFDSETRVRFTLQTTEGERTFYSQVTSIHETEYLFRFTDLSGVITGFLLEPTNIDCTVNLVEIQFLER